MELVAIMSDEEPQIFRVPLDGSVSREQSMPRASTFSDQHIFEPDVEIFRFPVEAPQSTMSSDCKA